jgi:hypothetical protein
VPSGVRQLNHDLAAMRGVWLDNLRAYDVGGAELGYDANGGVPGAFPYQNLVYVDFDGALYTQTNVTYSGRPIHVRTFFADVADGVLRFRSLGPNAPAHVGVSGGPGLIWFVAESLQSAGLTQYSEPDLIRIDGDERTRQTVLYRGGQLVRTMFVAGTRLSHDPSRRYSSDPRGVEGEVHDGSLITRHYEFPAQLTTEHSQTEI